MCILTCLLHPHEELLGPRLRLERVGIRMSVTVDPYVVSRVMGCMALRTFLAFDQTPTSWPTTPERGGVCHGATVAHVTDRKEAG